MVLRRKTPEDDIDRLAERIWQRGRGRIRNKADFLSVYSAYLYDNQARDNRDLRDAVFGRLRKKHPKVSTVVVTRRDRVEAFREAGMRPAASEFSFVGKVRGKTVYARRGKVRRAYKVKGEPYRVVFREFVVYRDKKGRFVKVK